MLIDTFHKETGWQGYPQNSLTAHKGAERHCVAGAKTLVGRFRANRCTCTGTHTGEARWRSGDAEDCKSLHAGSIPARASTSLYMANFLDRPRRRRIAASRCA